LDVQSIRVIHLDRSDKPVRSNFHCVKSLQLLVACWIQHASKIMACLADTPQNCGVFDWHASILLACLTGMKQSSFILSLIIPGPSSPGMDLDVYLQPLIEELQELWNVGVRTFDASKKNNFVMRAQLMWTINDFPAYADLSGWPNKGEYACPCCMHSIRSKRLKHDKKHCYIGHRRYLPMDHPWRRNKNI
jgi:hypothetical protein